MARRACIPWRLGALRPPPPSAGGGEHSLRPPRASSGSGAVAPLLVGSRGPRRRGGGGRWVPCSLAFTATPEAGGHRGLRRSGGSCRFQQWRLLPYLAATWALDHFSRCLFLALRELQLGFLKNDQSARQVRTRLPSVAAEAAALKFLGPNSTDAAIPSNQPQCLLGLRGGDPVRPLSWAVARTCQACVHVPASQGCADMAPASCL